MRTTRWLVVTAAALLLVGAAARALLTAIDRPPEEDRLAVEMTDEGGSTS